ncbi:MAG: flagellar basal body-associated FliL family protein [Paracoccaceae bacterium]
MSETKEGTVEPPKKSSKLPLILGVVLALTGGGGGYYAVSSGMVLGAASESKHVEEDIDALPDVAFVPVDPITVSMNSRSQNHHLRFRAQLEVPANYEAEVQGVLPRVVDVLNGYLRALEAGDLEDQSALTRLRGQMLRRIQIVTGSERVSDLLIMEFVLN